MKIYIFTNVLFKSKKHIPTPTHVDNGSYENFNENSFELNFQSNINKGHPMNIHT